MRDASQPVMAYLIDDERDVTDALAWLLESVKIPSHAFVSTAEFLDALPTLARPACAVLDLRMLDMSGLELQRRMIEGGCDMPVIFLSAHGDVPAAVNAMQAGAIDFLQKSFNPEAFLASVHRIGRIARERHAQHLLQLDMRRNLAQLSAREHDVLTGLLDGRTSKEIGKALGISPKTVDVHRANVIRKMGVDTSAELLRMLGRSGDSTFIGAARR